MQCSACSFHFKGKITYLWRARLYSLHGRLDEHRFACPTGEDYWFSKASVAPCYRARYFICLAIFSQSFDPTYFVCIYVFSKLKLASDLLKLWLFVTIIYLISIELQLFILLTYCLFFFFFHHLISWLIHCKDQLIEGRFEFYKLKCCEPVPLTYGQYFK